MDINRLYDLFTQSCGVTTDSRKVARMRYSSPCEARVLTAIALLCRRSKMVQPTPLLIALR